MPTKFDFLSPGIQLREIDQSQVPETPENPGILLIGRARSGPAMKPIKVRNLNDFVDIFGLPIDGVRQADPWRQGNTGAPNYAAYAAQAYLAAGVGPVQYVRLLGKELNTDTGNAAGWSMGSSFGIAVDLDVQEQGALRVPANAAAYGLFIVPSGSTSSTGTLAAILYSSGSAFGVSGSWVSGSTAVVSSSLSASTLMNGSGASYGVKLGLSSSAATNSYFNVNFAGYSNASYIRNVLNTDPTKFYNTTNYGGVAADNESYFLGETFDVNVDRLSGAGASADTYYFIAGLGDTGAANYDSYLKPVQAAKSGWFIGQRPDQKYLFQLIALDDGEEFQNNYYCRIANINLATTLRPQATFTLQIVKRASNINKDIVAEEYTNLTLNPDSENYIVKRIGDLSQEWNAAQDKFSETGIYPNISNYVRVVMAENASIAASDCPVGFLGPYSPPAVEITSVTAAANSSGSAWIHGSSSIALGNNVVAAAGAFIAGFPAAKAGGLFSDLTTSIPWPSFGMTTSNTLIGTQDYPVSAYFGLRHVKTTSLSHDKSFQDIARRRANINPDLAEGAAFSKASFVFTLEDIRSSSAGGTTYYWDSGSYNNTGNTMSVAGVGANVSAAIDANLKQFAAPFFGGVDGIDVRLADPFSDYQLGLGTTKSAHYTVNQAIEMVADPEQVEYELLSMPGLVKNNLVDKIVNTATERGDALAIIDLTGIEQPLTDNNGVKESASQTTLINSLNTQYIDSSYAATYFPNVRLRDTMNGNGTILAAPPSVAGIGAIAQSEAASQPWFAPAGFNRGGLARLGGTAGPQVVGTVLHLTKDNRDVLYEAQVNPIARFPATGDTVIFGQKTLQQDMSALDRINVRRLMIYLKRHIGNIAETILFDQNVRTTWLRFKSRADAVLSQVQAELGIVEYKLVLDETTTTADLIDRNIMYAKVFVKPARSIEFIAVDFIITRSGVEF